MSDPVGCRVRETRQRYRRHHEEKKGQYCLHITLIHDEQPRCAKPPTRAESCLRKRACRHVCPRAKMQKRAQKDPNQAKSLSQMEKPLCKKEGEGPNQQCCKNMLRVKMYREVQECGKACAKPKMQKQRQKYMQPSMPAACAACVQGMRGVQKTPPKRVLLKL